MDNLCHEFCPSAPVVGFVTVDDPLRNGLPPEPPVAFVKSHWNELVPSCCMIVALLSSELIGEPWRWECIQSLLVLCRFMLPLPQLWQLLHRMLAVIMPLENSGAFQESNFGSRIVCWHHMSCCSSG